MANSIKDLIERPHPIYSKYHDYWDFLMESYEGGRDYLGDYLVTGQKIYADGKEVKLTERAHLWQHPKERNDDYKNRIKMSYYYNFCAPIIDIYTNHLFKKPIIEVWKSIEQLVEYRKDNIDRKDSSIYEFRKVMADLAQIYGHMYVVTDKPNPAQEIYTLQDQIDNGVFPYFTAFHPQDVINWALDVFGQPYWVLLRERRDANQNPFDYDKESIEQTNYRLWTRKEWVLYDSEGVEMRRATHNAGMVPITCVKNKPSKKNPHFLGISAIADIAYIGRDIYNSCSELKQILRDQTFAILTLQGEASEYNESSVGTSKALLYPTDRNAPSYISPAAENAKNYYEHIDRQISAMFRLAKLEGGSAQFKGQNAVEQSGVSKAWNFNETNQALADKADYLQDAEMKLWRIFGAWEGKKFDGSIIYPDEFSVQSLSEDLDEAERALKLNIGKSFNVEVKKAIVKKKFPRMPEEDIKKMLDEVEKDEGKGEGGRLFDRIMNRKATDNANSGGKKEE